MQIKLAEALLRRKELAAIVSRLEPINQKDLFEIKGKRTKISEDLDDVIVQVPKLSYNQITHAYDHHARALREIDAVIQQANWTTELTVKDSVMEQYVDPYVKAPT